MALNLSRLNPEQRRAATTVRGPVLILAGAGTGKTRVITYRIAHLLDRGVPADRILAMTFTNKAAREMRDRVRSLVGRGARGVTISTFHSFGARFLREEIGVFEGYRPNFVIYDEGDQVALIKRILHNIHAPDASIDVAVLRASISRAKNAGLDPDAFSQSAADDWDEIVAPVYRRYQRELRAANAVDFDDLLVLTARALETPEVARRYHGRYRQILIDEFQDTNGLQLQIARRLARGMQSICVVGDDDQSIYAWRGAEASNILDFERWFPNPTVIALEQNYRSTNRILDAANALIRNNAGRREKNLWSALGDGGPIWVLPAENDRREAERVAGLVASLRTREGVRYEHHAVLYRTNAQSRALEEAFRRARIPYRLVGGTAYYERREVKDAIAYLRLLVNPDDDIALLRVINLPPRGLGARSVTAFVEAAKAAGGPVYAALADPDTAPDGVSAPPHAVSARAHAAAGRFHALIESFRDRVAGGERLVSIATALLTDSGYSSWVAAGKDREEAISRSANLQEFVNAIEEYERDRPGGGLEDFLESIALAEETDKEDDRTDDGQGTTLTTIHAAKGLEYPYVHLVGLEQGILPHQRSLDTGDIGEERRLLYVAITRARRNLTLSFCRSRRRYGNTVPCWPSAFLRELPSSLLRTVGADIDTLLADTPEG